MEFLLCALFPHFSSNLSVGLSNQRALTVNSLFLLPDALLTPSQVHDAMKRIKKNIRLLFGAVYVVHVTCPLSLLHRSRYADGHTTNL